MTTIVAINPKCPACGGAVRVGSLGIRDLTGGGPRPGELFEQKSWRCDDCAWTRAHAHFEGGLVAQDQDAM